MLRACMVLLVLPHLVFAVPASGADAFIVNPNAWLTAHAPAKLPAIQTEIVSGICHNNRSVTMFSPKKEFFTQSRSDVRSK